MVESQAVRYWRKVRTLQDGAHEAQIMRERRFSESGDRGALEGQEEKASAPDGGLFLMSLEHEERCTLGGRISAIPWIHQGVGRKLADKTHRLATAEEIAKFKRDSEARRAAAESAQERLDRRLPLLIKPLAPIGGK